MSPGGLRGGLRGLGFPSFQPEQGGELVARRATGSLAQHREHGLDAGGSDRHAAGLPGREGGEQGLSGRARRGKGAVAASGAGSDEAIDSTVSGMI